LALVDVKMPKIDGFELYNEIRKIDDKVKSVLLQHLIYKKMSILIL
jgi:YesN/AraC family two-component response regulator